MTRESRINQSQVSARHPGPHPSTVEQTHYLTPAGTPASGNWRTNQFKARWSPADGQSVYTGG